MNERVVVDGAWVFAAGVTAGIDGALRLAAELRGDETAQAIQLHMVYAPEPPSIAAHPRRRQPRYSSIQPDKEQAIVVGEPDPAAQLTAQHDQLMSERRIRSFKPAL